MVSKIETFLTNDEYLLKKINKQIIYLCHELYSV
jgi:hypothetical protein